MLSEVNVTIIYKLCENGSVDFAPILLLFGSLGGCSIAEDRSGMCYCCHSQRVTPSTFFSTGSVVHEHSV